MSIECEDRSDVIDSLAPTEQEQLASILEGHLQSLERGEAPDEQALVAAHPALAGPLRNCLASLHSLHRAAIAASGSEECEPPAEISEKRLGDYRLVNEISRGGMGVVYEARQISLGRKVALKVLPFAALLDPKQIARFNHEAQAAAQLNHPNIVPVYGVGCERGVHYYSMQFIEGQALDEGDPRASARWLRRLRRDGPKHRPAKRQAPAYPAAFPKPWRSTVAITSAQVAW